MTIKVVNFPFCNYYSLERYLRLRGHVYEPLTCFDSLSSDDTIILPGVGTFGQGMRHLLSMGLSPLIQEHARSNGRVIGICLGMQLLLESSSESPGVEGLGIISGRCERIPGSPSFSVPHIGWNSLLLPASLHSAVSQLGKPLGTSFADFYFVHSYVAKPSIPSAEIASFQHPSGQLAASVAHQSVVGFQFHPEKSGSSGYALLDHVLAL
jgi:glutamine amidotransferase